MHLVFLNQYFPPDVAPTGVMLRKVAEVLVGEGHQVTVVCAKGGYGGGDGKDPVMNGLEIIRLSSTRFGRLHALGKLMDYGSFYGCLGLHLLGGRKPDVIVALTTPPYLSLMARMAALLRGARHGHWVMDLYPDVLAAHGVFDRRWRGHRLFLWLARQGWGARRNIGVLSLGPDMNERVSKYLPPGVRREWVALWGTSEDGHPPEDRIDALREKRGWRSDQLVLMYSGNMGLGHRFGEFLEAAKSTDGAVRWAFYGGGKRRGEIERFLTDHVGKVELHGYVASEDLAAHLGSADVHLASLEPSWDGTMVPSKLQGIFAAGRPVIFVGSRTSSIGSWILESGAGWVVEPGRVDQLIKAIDEAKDPDERAWRGRLASGYAESHFDPEVNASAVARFFLGAD